MWYDNERFAEEEGISKLLVGKSFAYFPKYVNGKNDYNKNNSENNLDSIDNIRYDNKEYILITQRLGRTIIPLNPELLAHSTFDQEIIDNYLSEIHQNVHKYSILTEYSFLMNEIPKGFYCLPQYENLLVWDAFIILYNTYYRNGKFKLQIHLGDKYPHSIPEVYFLTPVFHPLINPVTGKLNLGLQLSNWNPSSHYISILFLYIKNIFYLQEEYAKETIENEEAYLLLKNDREMYCKKVKKLVEKSNKVLYNKTDNFMFNFDKNPNNNKITEKLESIKNDPNIYKKIEAFIYWLINEYYNETVQDDLSKLINLNIDNEKKEIQEIEDKKVNNDKEHVNFKENINTVEIKDDHKIDGTELRSDKKKNTKARRNEKKK